MFENEIIDVFKSRQLNIKNNNYIFSNNSDFSILDKLPGLCGISCDGYDIEIDMAYNIKVDLKEVAVKDILTYVLETLKSMKLLDVSMDYELEFVNKYSLFKFSNVLRNFSRIVQLVFFNVDELDIEDQVLFNELYSYNSLYFNVNSFIKESNFKTYLYGSTECLDDREDYTKVTVIEEVLDCDVSPIEEYMEMLDSKNSCGLSLVKTRKNNDE